VRAIKTLPHASRGWWGASVGGEGVGRVLYVMETDLEIETPDIELEIEDVIITLEVEIDEVELEDDT